MTDHNLVGLLRDWVAAPEDELCSYYTAGNRILTHEQGGRTVAVRYTPVDSDKRVVIARDDFAHGLLLSSDCQLVVVNSTTATKIFKFFDAEYMVLRGRALNSSDDGRSIHTAINTILGLGLPLPERLDRAYRCPDGFYDYGMPLLAFCDLRVPRRYRFAMYNSNDLHLPTRTTGSVYEYSKFFIFESREDAVQSKLKSDNAFIIDLWGDPPESPPVA